MMACTFSHYGDGLLPPSDMAMATRRSRSASTVQVDLPGIFDINCQFRLQAMVFLKKDNCNE